MNRSMGNRTAMWNHTLCRGLCVGSNPIQRRTLDITCTFLTDCTCKIKAIWICSRPFDENHSNMNIEHWCIKVYAPPTCVSIDLFDIKFGLEITISKDDAISDSLENLLMYDGSNNKQKWNIIASITPSPLKNISYLKYIDNDEISMLKKFMKAHKYPFHMTKRQSHDILVVSGYIRMNMDNVYIPSELIPLIVGFYYCFEEYYPAKTIKCNKKVCDIADFIGMWAQDQVGQTFRMNNLCNKEFAIDLFQFLVGNNYAKKATKLLKFLTRKKVN
eukprot:394749_1